MILVNSLCYECICLLKCFANIQLPFCKFKNCLKLLLLRFFIILQGSYRFMIWFRLNDAWYYFLKVIYVLFN